MRILIQVFSVGTLLTGLICIILYVHEAIKAHRNVKAFFSYISGCVLLFILMMFVAYIVKLL